MNKKTKIMLTLLSAAVVTAGAMGVAGCSGDKESTSDAYDSYVAYAADNGQEAMSYEEWLKAIKGNLLIKGDTGAAGAPGAAGQPGAAGAAGKGVESVALSTDGKKIVITYDDDTTDEIDLPEEVTHVHTYSEEPADLVVLLAATEDTDGVAYKVCTGTGCDHKELVILEKTGAAD